MARAFLQIASEYAELHSLDDLSIDDGVWLFTDSTVVSVFGLNLKDFVEGAPMKRQKVSHDVDPPREGAYDRLCNRHLRHIQVTRIQEGTKFFGLLSDLQSARQSARVCQSSCTRAGTESKTAATTSEND